MLDASALLKEDAGLELNISKTTVLSKAITQQALFDVAHAFIINSPQLTQLSGEFSLDSFHPDGFVGIGVPIGTDDFVRQFVAKKCRDIIEDVEKLDAIEDSFIHFQLLRFCRATRRPPDTISSSIPLILCTTHSGAKKAHDCMVDQLADLFRTTHEVKTQQVVKSRGQHCGDIDLVGYLVNETGPVTLVLDLRIDHDRVGSSTDTTLNGHLKYPNNLDQSLNDAAADKIRKYRVDYNNRSPSVVSFIPAIASTSGRLHSEFVRLLFLQAHRETDRFFAASGVQLA
jgi:hypothetical protein